MMEQNHDWRGFQETFYPHRRSMGPSLEGKSHVYVIVEGENVVAAFCEGEDLSSWVGANLSEVSSQVQKREMIVLDRKDVDQVTSSALTLPHFYDQVELVRTTLKPIQGPKPHFPEHFLLHALASWWSKLLPSAFGVLIRVQPAADVRTKAKSKDFFILIRRGKLECFRVPDLHSLGREREDDLQAAGKYLSEKYLVPVQAASVPVAEWEEWVRGTSPWREVAKSLRAGRTRLMPFRWGTAMMIGARAYLGF